MRRHRRRVADCDPELLPDSTLAESGTHERRREKRRSLLAYVREHPEELRPHSRKLEGVTRALSNGKEKLPEGLYVNVNFATQFSNEAKPVRELVSFHLDSDKKWRLSGYTVR